MSRTYLDTSKVDVTFNAWWKEYGNTPGTIQKALEKTRQQIGPPMDPGYVPPPLRTGGGAQAKTSPTIERITLMSDNFVKPLVWDDVIGPNMDSGASKINIEIEASGDIDSIPVTLTSRLPNKVPGAGTIASSFKWDVPRSKVPAPTPGRNLFRLSKAIADAGPFLGQTGVNDVATIVRVGGTSDVEFRTNLGPTWTLRGIATQPATATGSTGNETNEVPDARALLKAAGVEVLEVAVPASPGWKLNASKVIRLIRKPCKIVYYSGHGLSWSNALGIETAPHSYVDWVKASDLVGVWTPADCANLDVFIIAGCSLIRYDGPTAAAKEKTALAWAELLWARKGPLLALLGYRASAPADSPVGDKLARMFASKLKAGSTDYVRAWLENNGVSLSWNATGIDSKGYWWLEPDTELKWSMPPVGHAPFSFSNIKGPRVLPP